MGRPQADQAGCLVSPSMRRFIVSAPIDDPFPQNRRGVDHEGPRRRNAATVKSARAADSTSLVAGRLGGRR
jgi:hypothetical protein